MKQSGNIEDNNRPWQQYHHDQVKWSKSQYNI